MIAAMRRAVLRRLLISGLGLGIVGLTGAAEDGPAEGLDAVWKTLQREDYEQACRLADRLLEDDPDLARAHLVVGRCRLAFGDPVAAQESLLLALDLGLPPQDEPRAWYWLGRAAEKEGDTDGAADAFAMLLSSFPASTEADLVEEHYRTEVSAPTDDASGRRAAPRGPRSLLALEGGIGTDSNPRRLPDELVTESRRPVADRLTTLYRLQNDLGLRLDNLLIASVSRIEADVEDDWYLYADGEFGVASGDGRVEARLIGALVDYHDNDRLDYASLAPDLRVTLHPTPDDRVVTKAEVGIDWLEYEPYEWWGRFSLAWEHDWTDAVTSSAEPHVRGCWHKDAEYEAYDGYDYGLALELTWRPPPTWLMAIAVEVDGTDHRYDDGALDHHAIIAGLGTRLGRAGFSIGPHCDFEYRDYRNDVGGREDKVFAVGAEVQVPLGEHLFLRVDGGHRWHRSTLDFYDYERWFVQGGLAIEF